MCNGTFKVDCPLSGCSSDLASEGGTNFTQNEVEGLEAVGFTTDDGEDVFDKFAKAFHARQANVA